VHRYTQCLFIVFHIPKPWKVATPHVLASKWIYNFTFATFFAFILQHLTYNDLFSFISSVSLNVCYSKLGEQPYAVQQVLTSTLTELHIRQLKKNEALANSFVRQHKFKLHNNISANTSEHEQNTVVA